ncbi:hypothetical protein [Streptantibioticus cattleyicolor]|uniref:SRPBCC family protein n=1 Tax=Streptantibioticus cattleyicolor (strain ATCC 35852 / DSM 46488 / JCM 4925 / NBRC 14057 / NRRL 8057) TaxID=1003195 RepID=F8JLN4_STREN|nr:hypothetical protein [Streptantibioticus cattleyicolor]AEW99539.1 hypothetical protein SCATT_p13460 [Streptantibioticus cattleyicolor NRRL 8057 = DSM 46488]CCB71424.1 conserved protein of unknown function [Streptantibioticus cattleyicolor NRRL 8057 = DSM 46488]
MRAVVNVHARPLPVPAARVGALLDTLGGPDDRLWAHRWWPPVWFDRPLSTGARGGHGPVRYTVSHYVPGRWVRLGFTGPRGFSGFCEFTVEPDGPGRTVLRNTLVLRPHGVSWTAWPLFFRPMHDAALEDALDRVESALTGRVARAPRWSGYVRLLRALCRPFAGRWNVRGFAVPPDGVHAMAAGEGRTR